jgi:23S rRNA (adenine2503-C2)-methyltransferase
VPSAIAARHFPECRGGWETTEDILRIIGIVGKENVITCSVMCNVNRKKQGDPEPAEEFAGKLTKCGLNVKIFNPAGQDTIGGGCGQLHYVQEFLKKS